MPDPADESPDDISVYQLAEQVIAGMPRTDAAHREIAAELIRVRTEVQEIALRSDINYPEVDQRAICYLAQSMGIEGV